MNLPASTLLALWETGVALPPAARPAALLSVSGGESVSAVERLPLGRRDARLLAWYRELAGPRLEALTDCPQCGALVELEFETADIERPTGSGAAVIQDEDGGTVSWRSPDTVDFRHAAEEETVEGARNVLLERCLTVSGAGAVPEALLARLMELAAPADPQADVQLALGCPDCGADWQAPFDIGGFLWAHIEAEARRLLREVHELAASCGWSEAEILSLPAARRTAYLQLARGA